MFYVKVYPDLYSPHITQVYSGLYDLAQQGKITLKFTGRFENNIKKSVRNSVLCVQVSDSENSQCRTVCFDMFDGCEISSVERLRLCDVYIKRSYYDEYVRQLDAVDRTKIVPYGLNYECRSRNESDIFRRLLIYHFASSSFSRNPVSALKHFLHEVTRHVFLKCNVRKFGLKPMAVGDFLVKPGEPAELKVLFQTRLWTALDCPRISEGQLTEINDGRVNTVRSLKRRFGDQFVGGLMPTAFASKHFPDCCLPAEATARENYMNLVKRCLVCVTTTGLHNSIGFKFPEYLAASRCIVTEPIKYQLPVSLKEGKNYLLFRTPGECVEACEKLLANPGVASQMRHENYQYYSSEVEPSALIYKCLRTAMSR